ncbi:MAG: MarR family winged helix-turn-helix transcriptional regulator [Clostridia bacterium]|nr:MarR family winged helix-turn-helix transcriptional regulator [Clostridia bacterium]
MRDRFENFTVAILRLNKIVQKIKLYEMADYGLKAIHVMCIHCLNSTDGLTASDLVKHTIEDKGAVSRALNLLKEKGYVSYDPKKYNSVIRLTDEGKKVAAFIAERAERAVNAGGGFLTEEKRAELYETLDSISENLKRYYDELLNSDK